MSSIPHLDCDVLRQELHPSQPLHIRMLAIHHIGKDGRSSPQLVQLLREVLRDDPDPVIRHDAAFAFGALMAAESTDSLAEGLNDPSVLVRHECLETLAFFDLEPSVRAAVERCLHDPHPDVRESAEMALAYQAARPFSAEGEKMLDYAAGIHVRWAAAFRLLDDYLAQPSDRPCRILSESLLTDPSPFMRHVAAFMLEEVNGYDARPLLIHAAEKDPSILVRHESTETLGFMRPFPETVASVTRLLDDPVREVALTARIAYDILQSRLAATEPQAQGATS